MNNKKSKDYINSEGQFCPICNNIDITQDFSSFKCEGTEVWRKVYCLTCKSIWEEIFTMVEIKIIKETK